MSEVDQIDPIDKLAGLIQTHVAGGGSVAGFARDFGPHFDPELLKAARAKYEKSVGLIRELKDPAVLVDEKLKGKDWYGGPKSGDIFWPGLKGKLEPNLPSAALVSVDESSSKILNLMTPPGSLSIRTRGLVLGHVQSGKTTSFMSVAAKAADVGYRLIIVLSGITDNLRSQTQDRLEEQLVGDDSKHKWIRLTTLDYDFQAQVNAAAQLTSDQHRLLAVVKKNPYRLRRLAEWLESAGEAALRSCPILIIDDEADQASIDVGKTRVSTINKLIRRILDSPKAAYVAYTATPFANLLIDPAEQEGLYPRNFIVNLPAGGDYYGPERLFGRNLLDHVEDDRTAEPDDVIRKVPEADIPGVQPPKGKGAVAHWQPEVAPSMAEAINWFVLATAARWARGHTDAHSSMLIHTSMLADAHFLLKGVVDDHCAGLLEAVRDGDPALIESLRVQWEEEYDRVAHGEHEPAVTFVDVLDKLEGVLSSTQVIVDNYKSTERLVYKAGEPTTCIAIGGNTLSRGLTLEGLISSYFVRAASAYDTLLQMGRWFGYRRGYSDLVRIWMTEELAGWFRDLATVEAEIRREIGRYESEKLDPSQLAVKIRTHPAMTVTAAAKMRSAVQASLDYSGKREQTLWFKRLDAEWLAKNWKAGADFLERAASEPGTEQGTVHGTGRFVLRSVPVGVVLDFLEDYQFDERSVRLKTKLITSYIEQERQAGGLLAWNVVVMSNQGETLGKAALGPAGQVNLVSRSRMAATGDESANIKALAGSTDRGADLGTDFLSALGNLPADKDILAARDKVGAGPLIALYPISRDSKSNGSTDKADMQAAHDLLGMTIYFPKAINDSSVVTYLAADLSGIPVEEPDVDIAALDASDQALGESETAAAAAAAAAQEEE